jgi:hypothetical protein
MLEEAPLPVTSNKRYQSDFGHFETRKEIPMYCA